MNEIRKKIRDVQDAKVGGASRYSRAHQGKTSQILTTKSVEVGGQEIFLQSANSEKSPDEDPKKRAETARYRHQENNTVSRKIKKKEKKTSMRLK